MPIAIRLNLLRVFFTGKLWRSVRVEFTISALLSHTLQHYNKTFTGHLCKETNAISCLKAFIRKNLLRALTLFHRMKKTKKISIWFLEKRWAFLWKWKRISASLLQSLNTSSITAKSKEDKWKTKMNASLSTLSLKLCMKHSGRFSTTYILTTLESSRL